VFLPALPAWEVLANEREGRVERGVEEFESERVAVSRST
jgi:hypothetical protein